MAISLGFDKQKFVDEGVVMNQLKTINDDLESQVAQELQEIMESVRDLAIEYCPKETGALASSISLETGTISSGDFYGCSLYAGSENIVNPISGKPTSEYALLVHDGHMMRDGTFWEGEPFLEDAMMAFESELEAAVGKALQEIIKDSD
jgi:hypothetical protein